MIGHHNSEKKYMENALKNGGNKFFTVYGRWGNQAGEVVRSLCRNLNHIYYYCGNASEMQQMKMFAATVFEHYGVKEEVSSYDEIFSVIERNEDRPFVLIIDEIQNIVKKDSTFTAALASFLGRMPEGRRTQAYLCSTDVSWVEGSSDEDLRTPGNFYGGNFKVKELEFVELVRLFPKRSMKECISMYGVTGGVPDYLPYWSPSLTVKENIIKQILSPRGGLYNEAENFLKRELRETAVYETILGNIAAGNTKLNNLHAETGFSRAKISVYMKNLAAFDVIEKVNSLETGGWENAQKGVYKISDTFLDFWYTFVYPHQSDLHSLSPEEFYDKHIEGKFDKYLEKIFIKVAGEYLSLLEKADELPMKIHKSATWIGKDGNIDIILQNDIRENLVAMCSWEKEYFEYSKYEQLEESLRSAKIKAKYKYFFSSGDFDIRLKTMANSDESVKLIDLSNL
ncbi:MAG: ATP-binding protein [Eubacterium sp.]|nr:ATP-binding protein [Eubacterium sp.]